MTWGYTDFAYATNNVIGGVPDSAYTDGTNVTTSGTVVA